MTELKSLTAEELLAEYRVAAISCDNQFQHTRMMKVEAELLRRLQQEPIPPIEYSISDICDRGQIETENEARLRAVAHSSNAGEAHAQMPEMRKFCPHV